jgi:hypothetical protein
MRYLVMVKILKPIETHYDVIKKRYLDQNISLPRIVNSIEECYKLRQAFADKNMIPVEWTDIIIFKEIDLDDYEENLD